VIVFVEHYAFRKGTIANYNLEAWNTRALMPVGYAGGAAFLVGVVGAVLGMVQTDYVGVISSKIGDYGGDIGNELALVFTLVMFLPLRYLEYKKVGR
jgi:purine-cytosine permease-like protein